MATYIIGTIVFLAIAYTIYKVFFNKGNCHDCTGNCGACSGGCCGCGRRNEEN